MARDSLSLVLEPLVGFALDSGLSIQDVYRLLRGVAVRSAAARQAELSGRLSISGISASTGIPRQEISRILNSTVKLTDEDLGRYQQSTNKILSAWHQDPKFTTSNGQPAELKIYGRGVTFDSLVKLHAKGIPTRAVLDELVRTDSIQLTNSQTIRPKTLVSIERGATPQSIRTFGERATLMLVSMLENMRHPERSSFFASAISSRIAAGEVPLLRREISSRGSDYLSEIQEMFTKKPASSRAANALSPAQLSVTVFYSERSSRETHKVRTPSRRRNFRRSM